MTAVKENIKIAHTAFSVSSSSGGIGPVIKGVTSALSKLNGIETKTYVPENGVVEDFDTPIDTFKCLGAPHHCFNNGLPKQISDQKFDILHCHGIWSFLARTNHRWKASGKPYVISPHGMTMPAAMKFSRWKKILFWPLLEKTNLRKAAFLHALSSIEAASIRALGIKTPIVQIGNGVDLPELAVHQETNAETNGGVRTILYLGRLHPIKGLDKMIGAWRSAKVNSPGKDNWRLQIVGWGQEDYVQKLKDQSQGDESILFSGPLFGDDKHRAMHQASAFILPSSSEAFPMALMEAWSHGLPAVATTTCNVLGDAGNSVSLFVGDTEEDIVSGIQKIVGLSDQERQTMGDAARAIVATDYSWQKIAQNFVTSYQWALGVGQKPSELMYD